MFRRTFIVMSLVMALAGTVTLAQGLRGKGARRGGSPAQRLERLQQKLNLNETQMNGIRALDETRRKERESLRGELKQKRQGLRQLMQQTNPNPTDVGNATLALKEERERAREINQRFMSGVKELLTPDQLQKLPKRLR
jgi:Spy/CpxP family protein refolding chaperone